MGLVLECNAKLVVESKAELEESFIERGKVEGELRRARMTPSNWQVMLLQSKHYRPSS